MERLKWEYEEEMRVRNEVAELNKKFKSESQDNQRTTEQNKKTGQNIGMFRSPFCARIVEIY